MSETIRKRPGTGRGQSQRWVVLMLALVLASVLGLGVYYGPELWSADDRALTVAGELPYTVERRDLLISFKERGSIKASSSVPIYCELEGQSTIVQIVPEGTYVKQGDLLVELDSSSLTQEVNQQQITVESAAAELNNAREQVIIQESVNNSEIQAAELDVKLAEIDVKKYEEGDYPLALKDAKAKIFIAEEELARAQNVFEWTEKLAARGYATRRQLQADKLAVNKANVEHEQAVGALEVLEKYTHEKDQSTITSALEEARDALERVKRKAAAEMAQVEAASRSKESTYNLSVQRLRKLEDQLGKTKIFAPQDGMVVYEVSRRGRERIVEQGAEVRENQLLMKLPDVASMAVNVQVHESWIDQVREGQVALVNVDALPNRQLRGTITKVGLLPDQVNRWLNPDLKVYMTEVTITAGEDTSLIRPGMSAMVELVVARLENVVRVPRQSLTMLDKRPVCYVLEDGEFRPRDVTPGRFNEKHVEIVSGLDEGEIIQLNAPASEGVGGDSDSLKHLEGIDIPELAARRVGDRGSDGRTQRSADAPSANAGPRGRRGRGSGDGRAERRRREGGDASRPRRGGDRPRREASAPGGGS